jgi:hypothetical protein
MDPRSSLARSLSAEWHLEAYGCEQDSDQSSAGVDALGGGEDSMGLISTKGRRKPAFAAFVKAATK